MIIRSQKTACGTEAHGLVSAAPRQHALPDVCLHVFRFYGVQHMQVLSMAYRRRTRPHGGHAIANQVSSHQSTDLAGPARALHALHNAKIWEGLQLRQRNASPPRTRRSSMTMSA
eukprot:354548-Chlamydomonas_euryale.AAC.13